ncbi:MAG: substrate-binding domain-containing protein, partial [Actinomycetota bacterium]|nr:substrate-binding domain-containing protein [Actinomycetota bacterium]
ADAVVVNAGTSAGREDFTKSILEEIGRVAVHGVAMKPGKPVVLGVVRGKPLLGLPGFPVANMRAAEEFLGPLVSWFLGISPRANLRRIKCKMARKIRSEPGFDEFVQVKVGRVGDELIAVPLARGSGISMSLVRSDGDVRIPADAEGVVKGDEVEVFLRGFDVDPEGTIIAVGSHDVALDILSSHLRRVDSRYSLASSNVGSISGILAIKEGICHIAGTHLLDPKSGEFNIPYVISLIGKEDLALMHLSWRLQGIMVQRGNPKGIRDFGDLTRKEVSFVNRQRGSGTRLLLDHELSSRGISSDEIQGYEREVFTHTQVAAAVASGTADAGLGIKAAAKALGIDFVPVTKERYDLLISSPFSRTPAFEALQRAVKDPSFRREVEALGGYELSDSGKIISLEGWSAEV